MKFDQVGSSLVPLLIFMSVGLILTSASVVWIVTTSLGSFQAEQSSTALVVAQSGAENGWLRLLRDSSYTGEVLVHPDGQATITVDQSGPIIITAVGQVGTVSKTVQIEATSTNGQLTITDWSEL